VKKLRHHGKLEDRLTPGVFIGYEEGVKAYRVVDPVTQRVHTTRNVVFDEDRVWNWLQEEDGNTGCNSNFMSSAWWKLRWLWRSQVPLEYFSDFPWYVSEHYELYSEYFWG
jgi:hypothetical protein